MNKSALKNFAVDSRKELIEKMQIKAMQYGIEKDKIKNSQIKSSDSVVINGKPLSKEEKLQREKLIEKIRSINEDGGDGYKDVIEEVAYTWFNRFTALRFMEINNYLPTRVRALSSSAPGNVEPELIKEASNVDLPIDKQKIYEMKLNNDNEGLFKYLMIAQCNALNKSLPFMFEKIGHYTELLFPDGLLNEGAFIRRLTDIETIPESDWEDVEIIGWLYQYYISEEKDRVIQAKNKYKKDEIPFATQLFTPDWIVRYMVQNSLGRYWIESHPEHSDLKKNWEFYLENPNPEPDFEQKLKPYINKGLKVEDMQCFDCAMGSGHILVYMFDVLYQIYEKCGYMSREIPQLIIENNLFGLDIDDRAYQLACFAVIMKGMKYNNRLIRNIEREAEKTGKEGIKLNLASIQETNDLSNEDIVYIAGESSGANYNKAKAFIELFRNAKVYGSLIKIEEFDKEFFYNRLEYMMNNPAEDIIQNESRKKVVDILPNLIKQAGIIAKKYDILVTNPPYMGSKYMNSKLGDFVKINYPDNKSDLFSTFIEYSFSKVKRNGSLGFMTPFVWMFIGSYEKLREEIINDKSISSLIQLEYSGFAEATVPICTFTLKNYHIDEKGEFIRLSDFRGVDNQQIKTLEAVKNRDCSFRFRTSTERFKTIPGSPIAYWISSNWIRLFSEGSSLSKFTSLKKGMSTGDNARFIKYWYEPSLYKIKFNCISSEDAIVSHKKWFPINSGGEFRKWYGNNFYVVNWENDGKEMKDNAIILNNGGHWSRYIVNTDKFFTDGITWSGISSSKFGVRCFDNGFLFSSASMCGFCDDNKAKLYILSLLNSKVSEQILGVLAPTLNFGPEQVKKIPCLFNKQNIVCELTKENISISRDDWDDSETSWEFKFHPFFRYEGSKLEEIFEVWRNITEERFNRLKYNEEELNRIFIESYGLKGDVTSEVSVRDITIRKADSIKDIKSFISYAIGCIFGRYSLDQEGIVYAGGKFDYSKYKSIPVDEDNILPILSDDYFQDDIVSRFIEFVKVTFGEETLAENLDFITEALGRKSNETAKETIRRYFINDFYKDHLQTYKNRPIYWMFTSGKQKAFNCLIYMHRYDKTTLSRIRTDYLHELEDRLDTERKSLIDVVEGDYSTKEKSETKKRLTQLDKQIDELKKYDEVLHHMADMQIEIDLDDGVVVNYEKFNKLLLKI